MRIVLHIGLEQCGAQRLHEVLSAQRGALAAQGVLFPQSPGKKNHTRLWMAVTDPTHVDLLRAQRGFADPERQAALRAELVRDLQSEIAEHSPQMLILSAAQLCWLAAPSELHRLRDLLAPLSDDISVCAHVDEQAALMARVYGDQVLDGRSVPLTRELEHAAQVRWWSAQPASDPGKSVFAEVQSVPFWLDYQGLVAHWDAVFGDGATRLLPFDQDVFASSGVAEHIAAAFGLPGPLAPAKPATPAVPPSEVWLAKARAMNHLLRALRANTAKQVPRPLWRAILDDLHEDGPGIDPARLAPISRHFAAANSALLTTQPALSKALFRRPRPKKAWQEPTPGQGYRASQVLLTHMWRIDKATRQQARKAGKRPIDLHAPVSVPPVPDLSAEARAVMPPLAVQNFNKLRRSSFAPHNRLGAVDEEQLAASFEPIPPRDLQGSSGNVIVGCMKNEAPYILEWVAYHRAMGVDNFLIYTNGCEDGTAELLDRLQELGILQHRGNDDWKGNSPQQYALNRALKEPVIQNADWIIHIDVDEFINVRCGNGTLDDLFAAVPEATNIAMTWRLFGHNGVRHLKDDFVIRQFETCAPKYCPKPHTVWGFKTMFRNIGAYSKISCHRPNKLDPGQEGAVKWVNGSGRDMTAETLKNGWRNSKRSIGYDLVQLNHYALRSAESFLIKRQRGRALHVDRSIGLNYWIRMDWGDYRDVTIQRNLPRMQAEYDRLMQDSRLAALHRAGHEWHRAKADSLHEMAEFRELYDGALKIRLTEMERVAFALALDMES